MELFVEPGTEEDLIERCPECEYCALEYILEPEQRKKRVLLENMPEHHITRRTVEEICRREMDELCCLKYAALRLHSSDRNAVQKACVGIYLRDLIKGINPKANWIEAFRSWTNKRDFGRILNEDKLIESYAERFGKVWDLGIRGGKQSLSVINIYEVVVSSPKTYEKGIEFLGNLKEEHLYRCSNGLEQ